MFRLSLMAAALLASTPALAGENAFKADLENPTISAVISEFEQVCFPFISHETELTPEQDREVFQSRMVEAGYVFDKAGVEKSLSPWLQVEPNNIPSTPTICPNLKYAPPWDDGKFTVFPTPEYQDLSGSRVEESEAPNLNHTSLSCQILLVIRGNTNFRAEYTREDYSKISDIPVLTSLTWQKFPDIKEMVTQKVKSHHYFNGFKMRTSYPPASSCVVSANDDGLTTEIVEGAMITNDPDWERKDVHFFNTKDINPNARSWSQCTHQNQENYVYSLSLIDGTLSLKATTLQNDSHAPDYNCKALAETD